MEHKLCSCDSTFFEIDDSDVTAFPYVLNYDHVIRYYTAVFPYDFHCLGDTPMSEMSVFAEIERSKDCHTKEDVPQKVFIRRPRKSQRCRFNVCVTRCI